MKQDLPTRDKPTIGEIERERERENVFLFLGTLSVIGFWTVFFILLDFFFGVK